MPIHPSPSFTRSPSYGSIGVYRRANPHAYVVAIVVEHLPAGPFAIQLGPNQPPVGVHRDRPPAATWQAEIERIRSLLYACEAFGNPGLISHAGTGLGLAMIQRDPELAAEQLQHALDLAIAVDIEYSTWQTRCHLASALTRLGRHREALELLAPDIQRHIRAGSSWFAWFQIRAGVDPLVGIGATGLAADLLDALEAHGYPVDELAAPRRRIGQLTEGTEGTPIRRRALTVAEAAAAIHHAVSERADAPARDLSGTAAPHEGRGGRTTPRPRSDH